MNTIGYKMNNKLTNVIGNKFANKMHTMGHKMTPLLNNSSPQLSNVIMPNQTMYDKKIIENGPSMDYRMGDKIRKKMKSRLTK